MSSLRVDGGASSNNLLMKFQADILNIPIIRPFLVETTAYGVANMAALTMGIYSSLEEIKKVNKIDVSFLPSISDAERTDKLKMWHRAVKKSAGWADDRMLWTD